MKEKYLKKILNLITTKFFLGRFNTIKYLFKKKNIFFNKVFPKEIKLNKKINCLETMHSYNFINQSLTKDGIYNNIRLKKKTLSYLIKETYKSKLLTTIDKRIFKNFKEVDKYKNKNKKPYCLLNLINPKLTKIAKKISNDDKLINIAKNYLGKINKIDIRTHWSPVCFASNNWREYNQQTVNFHYDVHDINFLYVFFYLTECDKKSGAHELIKGSHKNKKIFKHLLRSVKKSRSDLENDFNKSNFFIIKGNTGHGFIEDTSVYHKAHAPKKSPRLCLQIRYS